MKQTEQLKIEVVGTIDLESLSESEKKIFFTSLLAHIQDLYHHPWCTHPMGTGQVVMMTDVNVCFLLLPDLPVGPLRKSWGCLCPMSLLPAHSRDSAGAQ